MAVKVRDKRPNEYHKQIIAALKKFAAHHPQAEIESYRQNSVSVRIRIIDTAYAGKSRADREEELWKTFEELPEDVTSEISMVILLTPAEAKKSLGSFEFDNPTPSKI